MSSLRSNTPDPDDSGDSILDAQELGGGRRHHLMALGSLDDDDPNILLAIQLSLQDSAMAEIESNHDVFAHDASLGAIGTSLPSRLEQSAAAGLEVLSRASVSSSERLDLGDNLARLGNINIDMAGDSDSRHRAYTDSAPVPVAAPGGGGSSTGLFSSSSDTLDSTTCGSRDPSTPSAANGNLLGNIMAWFHDANPQGVALLPSTSSSDTDSNLGALHSDGDGVLPESGKPQEAPAGFFSPSDAEEEKERAVAQRPTQLDLAGPDALDRGSKGRRVDTPQCDSGSDRLASSSSSEWEDQVHLV